MRSSLLRRTVLVAALAGLVPAGPQAADRKLEIEWIDVLGGAATLIFTPAGESILVDTGWPGFDSRDAKRIKAALDRRGLTAIDHLVITHYHTDHYGGVPQLADAQITDTALDRLAGDAGRDLFCRSATDVLTGAASDEQKVLVS